MIKCRLCKREMTEGQLQKLRVKTKTMTNLCHTCFWKAWGYEGRNYLLDLLKD